MPQEEFDWVKENRDHLIDRFGKSYKNNYGWASSILQKDNPTFRDIEESVKLDYLRPFYKLASHNVHANPKGVYFKLGLYPNSQDILLAGPSNTGLADPAHNMAISLTQITITLPSVTIIVRQLLPKNQCRGRRRKDHVSSMGWQASRTNTRSRSGAKSQAKAVFCRIQTADSPGV
ncbi:MAG: DUF5677 domain-containing protein [Syntrophobacteria bacterium]